MWVFEEPELEMGFLIFSVQKTSAQHPTLRFVQPSNFARLIVKTVFGNVVYDKDFKLFEQYHKHI